MNNVVIAFPKMEAAKNIKKILAQSGYNVTAVCTTGSQVLTHIEGMETGIVVCAGRFVDMMYTEIYEYLPKGFQMLVISSKLDGVRNGENLLFLSTPLKVHELLQTLEMMVYSITRYRKKLKNKPKIRTEKDKNTLESAKALLMERNGFSEDEAHKYIQKRSTGVY